MAINVSELNAGRYSGTSLEAPIIQVYHFCFDRRTEDLLAFRFCWWPCAGRGARALCVGGLCERGRACASACVAGFLNGREKPWPPTFRS